VLPVPFGWLHDPLVAIAKLGTVAFFSRIHIEGIDEVPREGEGPFLALANHWNSAVDVSRIIHSAQIDCTHSPARGSATKPAEDRRLAHERRET